MRGFFEIGIFHGKSTANVGTLWRTASQLGAAGIFTVGRRYPQQASDTLKTFRHIPLREHADIEALVAALPYSCPLVGVEMGGEPLGDFRHPERAVYLLGAEDHGLPPAVLARCHHVVSLPSVRTASYNVAVAGALVMFDRHQKETSAGDRRVLWGIVANAGRLSTVRQPRWAHVVDATGLGSTSAAALCRRFGFEPDQIVGITEEEAACA